jgi:hypothetical protein
MKKNISEYIIAGSISVDSLEAYAIIVREFPGRPEILRMHADLLAAEHFRAAAVQQYDEAARLFVESGRLLQAWVAKILRWRLQRPSRDQLLEFHRTIEGTVHNGAPVDDFIQHLEPMERMAVFSNFRLICVPAGKTVLNAGKRHTNLHLVVSGVLKESYNETLPRSPETRREKCRILGEADSFGEIYPFLDERPLQPQVVTSTRSELLLISRSSLIRAYRRHPNVESGIVRLCLIRSKKQAEAACQGVRKGLRYSIPTCMSIEVLPTAQNGSSVLMKGYCRDLSVSGASFIPESNGTPCAQNDLSHLDDLIRRKVRITIPFNELSIAISGQIVRKRDVVVKGFKLQSLGIQFDQMPPRLRGAFFAFAESAKDADRPLHR